jgi:hypothetical protein
MKDKPTRREGTAKQKPASQIVDALRWLGIEFVAWPDFVQEFYRDPQGQILFEDCALAMPFQPPEFDRLNQSPEGWSKTADDAWQRHRDDFLKHCQAWVVARVDEASLAVKQIRGPGAKRRGARGKKTVLEERYIWAAKYLLHVPLKEIAGQHEADAATVGRVARSLLRQAQWLDSAKTKKKRVSFGGQN